jgi:CRISPR type III-B/RAMP module-associated protein Cmr5
MTSWLERALACVEQIEKVCDRDARSAFRARARQIPSDIYYVGTAYALAVLAARSSERDIFSHRDVKEGISAICSSKPSKEEKGYALYGLCLVDALRALGVKADTLGDALREAERLGDLIDAELAEYVDWLKKLAEAKFEKGE